MAQNTFMESKDMALPQPTGHALRWHVSSALVVHLLVLAWGIRVSEVPVRTPIRVQVAAPAVPPVLARLAPSAEHAAQVPQLSAVSAPVVPLPAAMPTVPSLPPAVPLPTSSIAPPPANPEPASRAAVAEHTLPAVPAPSLSPRKIQRPVTVSPSRRPKEAVSVPPARAPAVSAPAATASSAEVVPTQVASANPSPGVPGAGASTMQQVYAGSPAMSGGSRRANESQNTTGDSDTAPRLLHRPKPAYPWVARQRGFEGSVTLSVELLANGTVGQVKVLTSSGYNLLDKAAEEAAKSWKHTPATQNGVTVTRWARQVINFRLDER